jgi:hypothetical protein
MSPEPRSAADLTAMLNADADQATSATEFMRQRGELIREDAPRRKSGLTRLAPVVLAAVLVIGIAVVIAATRSSGGRSTGPAGPVSSAGYLGYEWRITAVTHGSERAAVAASRKLGFAFGTQGTFYPYYEVVSGVTNMATYRQTSDGFVVSGVLYNFPLRTGEPYDLSASGYSAVLAGHDVTAKVAGDTLTLTVAGYRIVCLRGAALPSLSPKDSTTGAGPTALPAPRPVIVDGRLTQPWSMSDGQIQLSPVPVGYTPKITETQISETLKRDGNRPVPLTGLGGEPLFLALLTDYSRAGDIDPGTGALKPDITSQPVWVSILYAAQQGHGPAGSRTVFPVAPMLLTINAETGKVSAGIDQSAPDTVPSTVARTPHPTNK